MRSGNVIGGIANWPRTPQTLRIFEFRKLPIFPRLKALLMRPVKVQLGILQDAILRLAGFHGLYLNPELVLEP